jgi:hypothetical protein
LLKEAPFHWIASGMNVMMAEKDVEDEHGLATITSGRPSAR